MFLTSIKQRIAAVLAILSMLLLFIAPLISLSLSLSQLPLTSHMAQSVTLSMDDMAMSAEMMHHEMTPQHKDPHSPLSSGMLCGYCDLVVHFPFFLWIAAALLWLIIALSRLTPVVAYQTFVLLPYYPPQLSRGPPTS